MVKYTSMALIPPDRVLIYISAEMREIAKTDET
jgi:hypothetical protein